MMRINKLKRDFILKLRHICKDSFIFLCLEKYIYPGSLDYKDQKAVTTQSQWISLVPRLLPLNTEELGSLHRLLIPGLRRNIQDESKTSSCVRKLWKANGMNIKSLEETMCREIIHLHIYFHPLHGVVIIKKQSVGHHWRLLGQWTHSENC